MKKLTILLACIFGLSLSARAQSTVVVGQGIMPSGSTLPTTCAPTKASDPDSLVLFYHTTTSGGAIGLYQCTATNTWTAAGGGGGGVTSLTGDGTVITNSASTGAVTLTIAGTSGGIPYFNSTSGWASSALLAANALVVGGGAGTAPGTGNGDFTYATHTLTMGASGLLDLSSGASFGAFRVPNVAGCTGTSANGDICYNTTDGNMHQKISGSDTIILDMTVGNFVTTNTIPKNTSSSVSSFAPTSITDDAKDITSTEIASLGNRVALTSDFTFNTNTALALISNGAGNQLEWTLPTSKALNVSFHCGILYSQATAAASDAFGIGITGTAPTQANAFGVVHTSASVVAAGNLTGLASTTATNVVTFSPSAATTIFEATLDGTVEQPSNATPGVLGIYVLTGSTSDAITVKRGSYCSLF